MSNQILMRSWTSQIHLFCARGAPVGNSVRAPVGMIVGTGLGAEEGLGVGAVVGLTVPSTLVGYGVGAPAAGDFPIEGGRLLN